MAKKIEEVKNQSATQDAIEQEHEKQKDANRSARPYTELEHRLRSWLTGTINDYERTVFPIAYEIIKYDKLFSGDRRLMMSKIGIENRSATCYPLISSVKDTFVTNLYDVATKSRAVARYAESQDKTEMAQDFYDWAYSMSDADSATHNAGNEAVLLGTSYGAGGFVDATKEYKYVSNSKLVDSKERVYKPSAQHVSFFDVFTELSTRDFYEARIKAVRKIVPFQKAKNMYAPLVDWDKDKEDEIMHSPAYISDVDYKRIYDINNYTSEYVRKGVDIMNTDGKIGDPFSFVNSNFFQILYKENDLVEVFEIYEWRGDQCYLMIMINGRCYYDGVSPFPNGDPLSIMVFRKNPGSFLGMGIGHMLLSHQKQINTYWNGINDAINQHIRPMYLVEKGLLRGRDGNTPSHIFWQDGKVLESAGGISNGGIQPIQFIDYQVIQLAMNGVRELLEEAMEIVGLNSYIQGGEGKVERTAQGAQYRMGIVRARLQPIIRSLDKFNQKLFETWLSAAVSYKPEGLEVRILGDAYNETRWSEVKPKDILGKFDVVVENEAVRQATKEQRMQYMLTTLQSLQQFLIDQNTGMPYVDFGDVLKLMFKEANFEGLKVLDVEETKDLVDKATEIAAYKQEKEAELAKQMQAAQGGMPAGPEGQIPMEGAMPAPEQMPVEGPMGLDPALMQGAELERQPGETDEEFFVRSGIVG